MFKQKGNRNKVVNREIRTQRHGAVVIETKRPRNIERFVTFKEMQKKEMYNLLPHNNGRHFYG